MCTKNFTNTKKFCVHEIAAINLSKIYFLKNAKKTCKSNNRDLNRDWINTSSKSELFHILLIRLNKTNTDLKYSSYLLLGASADCYSYGTTFKCTDKFDGNRLALRADVHSCQKPVVVDLHLEIFGLSFDQKINGNQKIPLPVASISELGGVFLAVKAEPNDDGDVIINV